MTYITDMKKTFTAMEKKYEKEIKDAKAQLTSNIAGRPMSVSKTDQTLAK